MKERFDRPKEIHIISGSPRRAGKRSLYSMVSSLVINFTHYAQRTDDGWVYEDIEKLEELNKMFREIGQMTGVSFEQIKSNIENLALNFKPIEADSTDTSQIKVILDDVATTDKRRFQADHGEKNNDFISRKMNKNRPKWQK